MKRDMDLIRSLLLQVETQHTRPGEPLTDLLVDGFTEEAVIYHIDLLGEAGLLNATVDYVSDGQNQAYGVPTILGITWAGHEFLDAIRDPIVWMKTKEGASAAGNWTLGLVGDIATAYARHLAAEKLGLTL